MPPPISSGMTLKRIHREILDLKKEDMGNIKLGPLADDNPFLWKARIPGPEGSVYEGGVFEVEVQLAHDYPFSAPKILFQTRIYHMNISDRGNVCIDILKHNWSPALSVFKVILSLSSLLTDPNPSDPLVPSIASEYLRRRATHDQTARQWTELYAKPAPPPPPPAPVVKPTASPPRPVSTTSTVRPSGSSSVPVRAGVKGKARAADSTNASFPTGTIEIDDSDDEVEEVEQATLPGRGTKRRRSTRARGSTIDLSEDGDAVRRKGKRRAVERPAGEGATGDVIVIED